MIRIVWLALLFLWWIPCRSAETRPIVDSLEACMPGALAVKDGGTLRPQIALGGPGCSEVGPVSISPSGRFLCAICCYSSQNETRVELFDWDNGSRSIMLVQTPHEVKVGGEIAPIRNSITSLRRKVLFSPDDRALLLSFDVTDDVTNKNGIYREMIPLAISATPTMPARVADLFGKSLMEAVDIQTKTKLSSEIVFPVDGPASGVSQRLVFLPRHGVPMLPRCGVIRNLLCDGMWCPRFPSDSSDGSLVFSWLMEANGARLTMQFPPVERRSETIRGAALVDGNFLALTEEGPRSTGLIYINKQLVRKDNRNITQLKLYKNSIENFSFKSLNAADPVLAVSDGPEQPRVSWLVLSGETDSGQVCLTIRPYYIE